MSDSTPPAFPLKQWMWRLSMAVNQGSLASIEALVREGEDNKADFGAFKIDAIHPLFLSALRGDIDGLRIFLEKWEPDSLRIKNAQHWAFGADLGSENPVETTNLFHGMTPLMAAVNAGHLDCVAALLEKSNPDLGDFAGCTPLMRAARNNALPIVRLLAPVSKVNAAHAPQVSALMLAAINGHAECVEALLAEGANPNAVNRDGQTPLARVLDSGQEMPETLQALLRVADLEKKSVGADNVLHWAVDGAADWALPIVLRALPPALAIELMKQKNIFGWTPLSAACWRHEKDAKAVDALLSAAAGGFSVSELDEVAESILGAKNKKGALPWPGVLGVDGLAFAMSERQALRTWNAVSEIIDPRRGAASVGIRSNAALHCPRLAIRMESIALKSLSRIGEETNESGEEKIEKIPRAKPRSL